MNDTGPRTLSHSEAQQLDRICDAFEQAWRAGAQPKIPDFLDRVADSLRDDLLRELIAVEIELRRATGETVSPQEYRDRFTDKHVVVEQAFAIAPKPSSPERQSGTTSDSETPGTVPETEVSVPAHIGRYRVERVLGAGNFGIVYLAHDPQLDRPVAIKIPRAERIGSASDLQRYMDEAKLAAQLDHPGIVRVHDVQQDANAFFVVQQYVAGQSLGEYLKKEPCTPKRTAELLAAVAEAVSFAHRHGLVHRDLKPDNILLDSDGAPHVADFGLALRETLQRRQRGQRAGSPAYMSPEQVQGLSHRLDGRSDIWSLGVILYEMLARRRPFAGDNLKELFEEILQRDPRPPRQIDPTIPAELERICLKCLSKRMTDRYTTAADLAGDLRQWESVPRASFNAEPQATALAGTRQHKIIPKGLRSFDADDADFFLELLPGPRDRDGLPDSIRFWKKRIEATNPDSTFSVGLIYGPSGCGKSSLVKAGLLPRLDPHVIPVYVEATEADTEVRLLKGLKNRLPAIAVDSSLPDLFEALRDGRSTPAGQKVLVVLDQFEQWLHAKRGERETQLVQALRHCDGQHVQCVVMVRDDFWLAVSRFMQALEVEIVEGHNSALVDLFDLLHARKVLAEFGRAYGRLPEPGRVGQVFAAHHSQKQPGSVGREDLAHPTATAALMSDQDAFLDQAVAGLAEDGKVISVRLALFAEMVKGKPWTPTTLKEVGGAEGVGVTFLEETFSATTAAPKHRLHQTAARAVLKALLPDSGTQIKGGMKSREELLEASGYTNRRRDFDELIRILDAELRLITPTEPDALECGDSSPLSLSDQAAQTIPHGADEQAAEADEKRRQAAALQSYQLTHDYLVPSLREWLTRKQKETWRGRAELRLEERTAQWSRSHESRFLPNPLEYASIMAGVPRAKRTPPQRRVMRAAGRRYGAFTALGLIVAMVLGWAGWEANGRLRADGLVRAVRNASIDQVPALATQLQPYRRWAEAGLRSMRAEDSDPDSQLHAALALLPADRSQAEYLTDRVLASRIEQLPVVRDMLRDHAAADLEMVRSKLWAALADGDAEKSRRFNAALALATFDADGAGWSAETVDFVVDQLLSSSVDFQARYRAALEPIRLRLVDAVRAAAADAGRDATQRILATNALVDFGRDQPVPLARALVVATERQYPIMLAASRPYRDAALAELQRLLVARPERVWQNELDVTRFAEPARAVVVKIENAGGLVHPHFAFCQSLPLAEFADLTESLRAAGYRPTRLRPYATSQAPLAATAKRFHITAQGRESASAPWVTGRKDTNYPEGVTQAAAMTLGYPFGVMGVTFQATQGALEDSRPWAVMLNAFSVVQIDDAGMDETLRCAVVWQRDGRDWQFRAGLDGDSVAVADQEMTTRGLEPVDVAGYLDRDDLRYAVLWGAREAPSGNAPQADTLKRELQRPTIEVGLTRQDFETKAKGDLTPVVLQLATAAADATPRVAVIWRRKRSAEDTWSIGDESDLTESAATNAGREAADIAVFRTEPAVGKRQAAAEEIDRLTALLAQKPDDPALLRARGMAAVNLGRDEQAVEDLTKFVEKNAGDVLGRHFLAVAQARLGKRDEATATLDELAKRAGDSSQGAYSRAVVGAILGSDADAVAALEEALKAHAGDSGFLYDAACAYALIAEHMESTAAANGTPDEDDANVPDGDDDALLSRARSESSSGVNANPTPRAFVPTNPQPLTSLEDSLRARLGVQDPDRDKRIKRYKERAIELLVLACDAGYNNGEYMRTDTDLESLWAEAGFQRVLARLGADRRYAAVWSGVAVGVPASAGPSAAGPPTGEQPAEAGTTNVALVESVESHGLDAATHLARCRELIAAGYRLRSIAVLPVGVPPSGGVGEEPAKAGTPTALVTASTWLRPAISESALDESARQNALAAVAMLQLGERDRAWEILQHDGDPRRRTYWIHDVRPLALEAETLAERLLATDDPREKFGLLQALGEYEPTPDPSPPAPLPAAGRGESPSAPLSPRGEGRRVGGEGSWRSRVIDHAVKLYRESPRRDLHAAARWLLGRWGEQSTVAEIDAGRTRGQGPADGHEWFTNGQGMTMVVIPAGEFWMGSPPSEPERQSYEVRHPVTISRPFAIADREVTLDLFHQFHQEAFGQPYHVNIEQYSPRRDNGPVVGETWFEALAFCRWLSDREGIDPEQNCLPSLEKLVAASRQADAGQPANVELPRDFLSRPGYRLPTEAEWEYTCRAGTFTRYNFGNDRSLLERFGWFTENSGQRTRPCGLLKPNDWGLFDTHGNAFEWCLDWYDGYASGRIADPVGPARGQSRLLRGGGWSLHSWLCRSADRFNNQPSYRLSDLGFRVVCGGVGGQDFKRKP